VDPLSVVGLPGLAFSLLCISQNKLLISLGFLMAERIRIRLYLDLFGKGIHGFVQTVHCFVDRIVTFVENRRTFAPYNETLTGMTAHIERSLQSISGYYRSALEGPLARQEAIVLSHFGEFNQAKIDHLMRVVESSVLEQGDKRQAMKRVYGVMVEILQNMSIHSTRDASGRMFGFVVLSRTNTQYHIDSGNLMLEVGREDLTQRLSSLNAMDINQVRRAYVDTLCNEDFTDKGGAGLGMLTVAKRAAGPIDFEIHSIQMPFAYVRMRVALDIAGNS